MLRKALRRFSSIPPERIRNVAIIAHVDHGKTTLVDKLLRETNTLSQNNDSERVMDSNALEKERGITIFSKCTSVFYKNHLINLVDTPGHSDFGGEVERILRMVDGVMLLVDVAEGPMAQTKFVLSKSLKKKLPSIVVLNKVDRAEQRVEDAELEVMELFEDLKPPEILKEYPVVYSSSKNAWAVKNLEDKRESMHPLLETIIETIPPPKAKTNAPFKFLVTMMSQNPHLGRIVTGRVTSGRMKAGQPLKVLSITGKTISTGKALKIIANRGIKQETIEEASAGDIVSIAGLNSTVTDTICDPDENVPLEADKIDPPTIEIQVSVNTSPLQGKEGSKLNSSVIKERLLKEAGSNVAIVVTPSKDGKNVKVKGRGELQLGILFETLRREQFEMEVSPPKIITRKSENGGLEEPVEKVTIEVEEKYSGNIIEFMGRKSSELMGMESIESNGKTKLVFKVASRTLIGINSDIKSISRGTAVMDREFLGYQPYKKITGMTNKGRLISLTTGKTTPYSLAHIEKKGVLFISPNTEVYCGMIIGESKTEYDLEVSPVKAKRLTNIRSAGNDENIRLIPPKKITIEGAISYIGEDELVEITPSAIRLRKKILDPSMRKKLRKQK